MPVKNTEFVKSLKKKYGSNWMRVYYGMRSKNPQAPQFQEAEGVRGHITAKSHQRPYWRRRKR